MAAAPQTNRNARVTVGGRQIPESSEGRNFLVIGDDPARAFNELLGSALARGDHVMVVCRSKTAISRLYSEKRGDVILSPFHADSPQWDLADEIASKSDVDMLARNFIPDSAGGGATAAREDARTLFSSIVWSYWQAGEMDRQQQHLSESRILTPGTIHRVLNGLTIEQLQKEIENTPAKALADARSSARLSDARAIAAGAIREFEYMDRGKGPRFSVRGWVWDRAAGEGNAVFVPYGADYQPESRGTIPAWVRIAASEAMSAQADGRRFWLAMDDLSAVPKIEGLEDMLTHMHKHDGRMVLGFSSIDRLRQRGAAYAGTVAEKSGNVLVLQSGAGIDGGTAGFAASLIAGPDGRKTNNKSNYTAANIRAKIVALGDKGLFHEVSDTSWRTVPFGPQHQQQPTKSAPAGMTYGPSRHNKPDRFIDFHRTPPRPADADASARPQQKKVRSGGHSH